MHGRQQSCGACDKSNQTGQKQNAPITNAQPTPILALRSTKSRRQCALSWLHNAQQASCMTADCLLISSRQRLWNPSDFSFLCKRHELLRSLSINYWSHDGDWFGLIFWGPFGTSKQNYPLPHPRPSFPLPPYPFLPSLFPRFPFPLPPSPTCPFFLTGRSWSVHLVTRCRLGGYNSVNRSKCYTWQPEKASAPPGHCSAHCLGYRVMKVPFFHTSAKNVIMFQGWQTVTTGGE